MSYILIDKSTDDSWEHASIVTNEDGTNKVFDTYAEAIIELNELQSGLIVGNSTITFDDNDVTDTRDVMEDEEDELPF